MLDLALAYAPLMTILAQDDTAGPPNWFKIVPWIAILGVMMLMMILPGRQQAKKRKQMMAGMSKNDRVLTRGGIIGVVVEIRENEVILKVDESNNTRLHFARQAIQHVFADKDDIIAAWGTFVRPKDRVAVKFNGLFKRATTHPEVINAVTNGLMKAGVDPDNIVVFDRDNRAFTSTGLKLNPKSPGPLFRATAGDYGSGVKAGLVDTKISRILLEADVLVNLPFLKSHVLAGVSGALKNHLGTVPNARDFHRDICQYVADLNALDPIKSKTRICIADALYGIYHRGPQFRPQFRGQFRGPWHRRFRLRYPAGGRPHPLRRSGRRRRGGRWLPSRKTRKLPLSMSVGAASWRLSSGWRVPVPPARSSPRPTQPERSSNGSAACTC